MTTQPQLQQARIFTAVVHQEGMWHVDCVLCSTASPERSLNIAPNNERPGGFAAWSTVTRNRCARRLWRFLPMHESGKWSLLLAAWIRLKLVEALRAGDWTSGVYRP